MTAAELGSLVEDAETVRDGGGGWREALTRLDRTVGQLDYLLRRAGRPDLIGALKAKDRRRLGITWRGDR